MASSRSGFMSKRILLIGGTGFLGTALRDALSSLHDIDVTVAGTTKDPADPKHIALDLLQPVDPELLVDVDVIVNLTGQVSDPMTLCERLNTEGIAHLLAAVQGREKRVVQISTTLVYGPADAVTEASPVHPDTPYAALKAGAERLLQAALPPESLLIARLCNLYGPGQQKGLLWFLTERVRAGEPVAITDNDGGLCRFFLHKDDAARMLAGLIAGEAQGVVNVVGDERFSIRELVALCGRIVGHEIPATYGSAPAPGNIASVSHALLDRLAPVRTEWTMESYLRKTLL